MVAAAHTWGFSFTPAMAAGQARAGQNFSPASSCLSAQLPKQGISEGFCPQYPPQLLLMAHDLGPSYPRARCPSFGYLA